MSFIKHDVKNWFETDKLEGFRDYFENKFSTNTLGTLKVQSSVARNWEGRNVETLWNNIATIFIEAIVKLKNNKLKSIPFDLLDEEDKRKLREAVCEGVQHNLYNGNIWQKVNASNVGMGGLQMNTDLTSWVIGADMFGTIGWNLIQNSEIDLYDWMSYGKIVYLTQTGNTIEIKAMTDLDENVPQVIWEAHRKGSA